MSAQDISSTSGDEAQRFDPSSTEQARDTETTNTMATVVTWSFEGLNDVPTQEAVPARSAGTGNEGEATKATPNEENEIGVGVAIPIRSANSDNETGITTSAGGNDIPTEYTNPGSAAAADDDDAITEIWDGGSDGLPAEGAALVVATGVVSNGTQTEEGPSKGDELVSIGTQTDESPNKYDDFFETVNENRPENFEDWTSYLVCALNSPPITIQFETEDDKVIEYPVPAKLLIDFSPVFRSMLQPHRFKEGNERVITFSVQRGDPHHPEPFAALIVMLHAGGQTLCYAGGKHNSLFLLVQMYDIAEFFRMDAVVQWIFRSIAVLRAALRNHWQRDYDGAKNFAAMDPTTRPPLVQGSLVAVEPLKAEMDRLNDIVETYNFVQHMLPERRPIGPADLVNHMVEDCPPGLLHLVTSGEENLLPAPFFADISRELIRRRVQGRATR